ncbi:auxin-induced in root cultures protein 12-like [Ananas comosus]|uniref:Auxin-induced in root cultures protein 12-like n=1 Tax=Ananas comosus TaxID=4615 RepID=A0A6P5FWA2_ANACO|nr:auxin-induced in root cultures protein 12-like [Ananas comosus]
MAPLGFLLLFVLALPSRVFAGAGAGGGGGCAAARFSNGRAYASCVDLPHLAASLHWTYDAAAASLSVAFSAPPPSAAGWVSWGINPAEGGGMAGAQALVAFKQKSGALGVKTYNISSYGPIAESPIAFQPSDLAAEDAAEGGGAVRFYAKLKLPEGTEWVSHVWQVGPAVVDGVPAKHAFAPDNLAAKGTLALVPSRSSGEAASAGALAPPPTTAAVSGAEKRKVRIMELVFGTIFFGSLMI